MPSNTDYAKKLAARLVQLDQETTAAYYEMGQILTSIRDQSLYDFLGFDSFSNFIEDSVSFSVTTARKYVSLYKNCRRLKYTKLEALNLIQEFGYTNICNVLHKATQKLGKRAIATRIENLGFHQMNFMLKDKEYEEVQQVFDDFGAIHSDFRCENASKIFMEIVRTAKSRNKAAA